MKIFDFRNIKYFTVEEIERTGAKIADVQYETIKKLDEFRKLIKCPVHLLVNGITTGNHESEEHPNGKATDFRLGNLRTTDEVVKTALQAGFSGMGVYWNSVTNSYHLDTGKFRFWYGDKNSSGGWDYSSLFKS